ncbi:MAG: hypothetical protein RR795_01590 [Cetobacterium sp.]|uniref:hypothetical protein n=1 Tax=Cetobacterium sp. TaxID=2071632 RepID=UPI002FC7D04C
MKNKNKGKKGNCLDEMQPAEIMNEICDRKLDGLMVHSDCADIFNLLNLHGFKRKHEYRHFEEEKEFVSIKKWIIERYGVIPSLHNGERFEINPKNVKQDGRRGKISKDNKILVIKSVFEELIKWEEETLEFLSECYKILSHHYHIADAKRVCELIEATDIEIKKLKREYHELKDVDFDLIFIYQMQKRIHDHHKEKMHEMSMCTI